MKIGVPKEIKNNEFRVALTPNSVQILVDQSHDVYVQASAGSGIGFTDEDYINSGAVILNTAKEVFDLTTLIPSMLAPLNPAEYIVTFYIDEFDALFTEAKAPSKFSDEDNDLPF